MTAPDDGLEQIRGSRDPPTAHPTRPSWLAAAAVVRPRRRHRRRCPPVHRPRQRALRRRSDLGADRRAATRAPHGAGPRRRPGSTWQLGRELPDAPHRHRHVPCRRGRRRPVSSSSASRRAPSVTARFPGSPSTSPVTRPRVSSTAPRRASAGPLAPGYVAEVAGSTGSTGTLDALVADMQRVIATVHPTDEATMLELLDSAAHNGDRAGGERVPPRAAAGSGHLRPTELRHAARVDAGGARPPDRHLPAPVRQHLGGGGPPPGRDSGPGAGAARACSTPNRTSATGTTT